MASYSFGLGRYALLFAVLLVLATTIYRSIERFLYLPSEFSISASVGSGGGGSTLLFSNAAVDGIGGDLAMQLAEYNRKRGQGSLHILAGVKSEAEKMSFSYSFGRKKGFEPILFDITEPARVADALYRAREIVRDLDRPLSSVIVNLIDESIESTPALSSSAIASSKKKSTKEIGGKGKDETADPMRESEEFLSELSMSSIEREYRTRLRSSIRLIEAALTMLKSLSERHGGTTGRVIFLLPSEIQLSMASSTGGSIGRALIDYIGKLRRKLASENIFISTITVSGSVVRALKGNGQKIIPDTFWELDGSNEEGKKGKTLSSALVHAVFSPRPLSRYSIGSTPVDVGLLLALFLRDASYGVVDFTGKQRLDLSRWRYHIEVDTNLLSILIGSLPDACVDKILGYGVLLS